MALERMNQSTAVSGSVVRSAQCLHRLCKSTSQRISSALGVRDADDMQHTAGAHDPKRLSMMRQESREVQRRMLRSLTARKSAMTRRVLSVAPAALISSRASASDLPE